MSLNVTARSLSESSFFPVIDTASAASAQGRAPADAFFARATLKALDLGDTGVRNAAFAPSASVESLFGAQTLTPSLTVPPVDLEVGASGPDVLNMQNCLVALGYLSQDLMNTNPGFFGQNTLAALNAFQAEHGLQPANRFGSGSRTAMNAAVSRLPTIDNIIDTAYRSLLGRAPDTGGQLSWRRGLEQQAQAGASPEQLRASIEAGIKASPEYQNRNVTPQQMVNDLYAQVLERPADTGGAQHFLQRYSQLAAQGMSRADIRNTLQAEMQASPEYGVKEMVKGLYQQLLGRGLDPAGRKGWVDYGLNQLAQGVDINAVRIDIANQIMASPEYQQKHVGELNNEPNHTFAFNELYPTIQKFAAMYGTDPQILAAVVAQESSFTNHIVHNDGTGHGLIGLDDGGLKGDFENWVRTTKGVPDYTVGSGADAISIRPEWQMEYLAKTIAELTNKYGGNIMLACREWHTGAGGIWTGEGVGYEQLIRQRQQELFG